MVEFQTVEAEEVKFGRNNFLEVARKKAVASEGENEFIAISRGFFLPDGTKRFRRSLAIPDDMNIINFISDKLKAYHKEGASVPEVPADEAQETAAEESAAPAEPAQEENKEEAAPPKEEAAPAESQ